MQQTNSRLVKTLSCGYTNPVTGAKLIHFLLSVLLCYGQVVSAVHAVEHLELNECGQAPSAVHHYHGIADDAFLLHTSHHWSHQSGQQSHSHSHTHENTRSCPDTGSHTEPDCKIYHAFQNLNGIGGASLQLLPTANLKNTGTVNTAGLIAANSLETPQIRAPPALS